MTVFISLLFLLILIVLLIRMNSLQHSVNRIDLMERQILWLKSQISSLEKRIVSGASTSEERAATVPPPIPASMEAESVFREPIVPPVAEEQQAPASESVSADPRTGPISIPRESPPAPPPAEQSLAEKLGTMGFVWIGAIALALSGIFLVKYSFEHGWISPAIRIAIAIVFGMTLLSLAEWMRSRSSRISEGLSAAAIADLYASFLAAYHLYHLIPAFLAFGLMGLTTAVAVLLSLRQGQFVAVLGLMGGFLTPTWIHTGQPNPSSLFSYLMLLQIGLLLTGRKKQWNLLMVLTFCGSMIWVALWLVEFFQPPHSLALSLFLMATVGLFVWRNFSEEESNSFQALNYVSIFAGAVLMAAVTGMSGYETSEWIFLGMLSAASLFLAAKQPRYFGVACGTLISSAALLLIWSYSNDLPLFRFKITLALQLVLFAGAGYALLLKTGEDARWAVFSVVAALALFLIGYRAEPSGSNFHWSIPSIVLAGLYLAGAVSVRRRSAQLQSPASTLAAMAVGVTAFVSLSIPLELKDRWIIVPFAVEVAALAAIARKLKVQALDAMAAILTAIVLALLAMRLTATPSWYWILYSYGISAASFAAAARFTTRPDHSRMFQWCSILIFLLLIALEAGQIHHPGSITFARSWLETGTVAVGWLAFALLLLEIAGRWNLEICFQWSKAISILAAAEIFLFSCIVLNPLFFDIDVGKNPVINYLLYVYGVPAILILLISRHTLVKGSGYGQLLKAISLVLLFLLMNFEIRQLFHGNYLGRRMLSTAEQYIYSASWVIFGILLTLLATLKRESLTRYASLVILLMAVCKVFLYDSANLTDLYRVLSFLGLGMSLLGIAYLYQKVLFRVPHQH